MEVGGVLVVQLVRILRARLNLALNQLRPARRDIRSILAEDPNSPQVTNCLLHSSSQYCYCSGTTVQQDLRKLLQCKTSTFLYKA